jgi:hypothetical protein
VTSLGDTPRLQYYDVSYSTNKTQCSTYQPIETKALSYSTNKTQETVVNITSLNPGTLYNISVTSVSNGQQPGFKDVMFTTVSCVLFVE